MYTKHLSRHHNEVLLCLHGWGQTHTSLYPLAKYLSSSFHTILFDLPGFGSSERPKNTADTLYYAEEIKNWLKEQNLSSVHILGHSFGGKIAMTLAQEDPSLFKTITLIAPSGGIRFHSLKHRLTVYKAIALSKITKNIQKIFPKLRCYDAVQKKYGSTDFQNAGTMKQVLINVLNDKQPKKPKNIAPPVLFLAGLEDKDTPPSSYKNLLKSIPNATMLCYPHKGHFPFSGSGVDLLAKHIQFFTQETTACTSSS